MKNIGLLILLAGCLIILFQGFNFMTMSNLVYLGNVEITHDTNHGFGWSSVLGMVMIFLGGSVFLFAPRKVNRSFSRSSMIR